jgi:hypothetical protein
LKRYVNPDRELYDVSNDRNLQELQETIKRSKEAFLKKSNIKQNINKELLFSTDNAPVPVSAPTNNKLPEYPFTAICRELNKYVLTQHITLATYLSNFDSGFTLLNQLLEDSPASSDIKLEEEIQKIQEYHENYMKAALKVYI